MTEKGRAISTLFKHLGFVGVGDAPMTFYFSIDKLTAEDKETANHIRLDVKTGRIFDDREEGGEVEASRAENEYLRMRLAEIQDKVEQMEPPEGFPAVYNHAYYAAKEDVKRIIE